jgi:Tfp pilus assembly protein PilO
MHTEIDRKVSVYLVPVAVLAVSMLLLSLALSGVIIPQARQIIKDRATIGRLKSVIETESGNAIIVKEINAKQVRLQQKLAGLTSDLADPSDLSGLLQMIFDQAWKANIKFDKTQPQPEVRGEDFIHYPILFEMTTSYGSLGTFIAALERMPQIMRIDRLALDANKQGLVEVKLMVTCFLALDRQGKDAQP